MPASRRFAVATAAVGLALIAAGFAVPSALRSDAAVDAMIERPLATCEAHGERLQDARAAWLRSAGPFADDLRCVLVALGAALLATGILRRPSPLRAAAPVAAIAIAIVVLVQQLQLVERARADGLFTESERDRTERFFDRTVRAAEILNEIIPPGARFLVIDFSNPADVNKLDYLVFPRRMFTLPGQVPNLGADAFRALLATRPDALAQCVAAGYRYAVDLDRLVLHLDPRAIVPIGTP